MNSGSRGVRMSRRAASPGWRRVRVRVLRLARGTVTRHTETLLSPCIPTLEDPFD
ncbi:Imm7 family immunity protein [Streptomyces sp. NPDC085612]|uniref:Imm7 family immunity protein n=1 Tax=Streptomyces sp. NPDC085612 TaxID=3365732 RepID=UPI0037CE96D5